MKLFDGKKLDRFESNGLYMLEIVVLLVAQFLAAVVSVALEKASEGMGTSGTFNGIFMIVFQLATITLVITYMRVKKRSFNFEFLPPRDSFKRSLPVMIVAPALFAALLMAGMYLPTAYYGYFTRAIGIPEDAGQIDLGGAAAIVTVVIASVFLAPVAEETVFRGALYSGNAPRGVVKAVFLSALCFMLMHFSPLQVVFQFALGVVSAYLLYSFGALLPCIMLHMYSNALALIVQFTSFGVSLGGCVTWLNSHIAAAVFITLGLFVASGAALFFGAKFAARFARGEKIKSPKQAVGAEEKVGGNKTVCAEESAEKSTTAYKSLETSERGGGVQLIIGLSASLLMFIFNLVSLILS